jgi:uncharacterized membrane protein YhhN
MPFAGGIEGTSNGTLVLSVAAALLYSLMVNGRPMPLRTVVKTLSVALLAVLAVIEGGPPLLFCALALSACGNAFLSGDGDRTFLAGLASFFAAYLCYIALFATEGGGLPSLQNEVWRGALAAVVALLGIVMLVLLHGRLKPALWLAIAAYVLAAVAMAAAALTMPKPWAMLGALLFIGSDTLLAVERFLMSALSPRRALLRYAVWVLYYVAQVLITLGFLVHAGATSGGAVISL